jgi:hypothetical protein
VIPTQPILLLLVPSMLLLLLQPSPLLLQYDYFLYYLSAPFYYYAR